MQNIRKVVKVGDIVLEWIKQHKQYTVAISVVLILLIGLMVSGHLKRDASKETEAQTEEFVLTPVRVFCRVILKDIGEYDVSYCNDGEAHVFLNGQDKGISSYSIVSSECKKLDSNPVEIDIEQYKDENLANLYNINESDAMSYIEYLIANGGYTEQARVYSDSFIEGLLEKDSKYTRYIVANGTLVIKDIKDALSTDYYIDNYIK